MYISVNEARSLAQGMTENGSPAAGEQVVKDLIERASRMFDRECGVADGYFEASTSETVTDKTFYGDGTRYLKLDPYVSGSLNTEITLPDAYTAPTFIEKNGYLIITASDGGIPIRSCDGWIAGLPVTVSARWGFLRTPPDVKQAIIELVVNLWRSTDPAANKLTALENAPDIPPRVQAVIRNWQMESVAFV